MKKEIRTLLLTILQNEAPVAELAEGDYSVKRENNEIELSVGGRPVATYNFATKRLVTVDWEAKKENRYLGYLLEQNGFEVHADNFLY